jgi:Uma2 family endonuclease
MRTVVLGERPVELERLIAQRRATGADLHDEVWEGAYHMAPAPNHRHALIDDEIAAALHGPARRAGLYGSGPFNLGEPDDYRVPDRGLHRTRTARPRLPTAALVVEIVSPGDESWEKLPFYAAHGVDEVVIADPDERSLVWMALDGDHYRPVERSLLLGVDVAAIVAAIDWPPGDEPA